MEAMNVGAAAALAVPVAGPVVALRVPEDLRLACLPQHFGAQCVVVENWVYDWMGRLCESYDGSYWHYYALSNGGFYMAPDMDGPCALAVSGNGFEGEVSADAAGIISCAMTYSHLSLMLRDSGIAQCYQQLAEFAADHAEARLIFAALD